MPPINLVENCIKITLEVMDKVTKGDGFGSGLVALLKKPMNELIMLANSTLPTKFSSFFIGVGDRAYQDKIIDCKVMDIIFDMCLSPYIRFLRMDASGRQYLSTPQDSKDVNPWVDGSGHIRHNMLRPKALQKFLNVALQLCFNENYRAQVYFSKRRSRFAELVEIGDNGERKVKLSAESWLSIIASMSEDPLGATVTLSKLFDNNEKIISSVVNPDLLQRFSDLIVKCGPQPRFLRFFESICATSGSPIIPNQEMVVRQLWMNETVRETVLLQISVEDQIYLGAETNDVLADGIVDDFLASSETNRGKEIPRIFVEWHEKLFFQPGELGLNNTRFQHHSGRKIPIEALCWILNPEELCEKVTGKKWSEFNLSGLVDDSGVRTAEDSDTGSIAQQLKRQEQLADWFVAQLKLLQKMVFGRSYNVIHHIEKVYTYPICLSLAASNKPRLNYLQKHGSNSHSAPVMVLILLSQWNQLLPYQVRSCALDLMVSLHIDRYPQLENVGKNSIPEKLVRRRKQFSGHLCCTVMLFTSNHFAISGSVDIRVISYRPRKFGCR